MKKNLTHISNEKYIIKDGIKIIITDDNKQDYDISGDLSGIRGDLIGISGNLSGITGDLIGIISGNLSGISGNLSGIIGNLTGIRGNLSGIRGDLDDCDISQADRDRGIHISELIK